MSIPAADLKRDFHSKLAIGIVAYLERFPRVALLLGVALSISAFMGLSRLEADFSHAGYFHDTDKWLQEFDRFEEAFGNDDAVIIAVRNERGLFNKESIELLHEMTRKMWLIPDVIRVDTITNYQRVRAAADDIYVEPLIDEADDLTPDFLAERRQIALEHETLPGYLISTDGTMTLLFGNLRPGGNVEPDSAAVISAARELVAESQLAGHEFYIVGAPMIVTAFSEIAAADNSKIIPFLLLSCIIILYIVLRSVWCVIYAMTVILLSAVGVFGLAGWVGTQVTSITTVLPQIMIGVAVADCVHILATYRHAQLDMGSRREAVVYALKKNVVPTLITSITTGIGFISFFASDIRTISELGIAASLGVSFTWLLSYLLLGPALLLFPYGGNRVGEHMHRDNRPARLFVNWLSNNRQSVLVGFGVFFLVGSFFCTQVKVDADPVRYFSENHPLRLGVEAIDAKVGSARNIEIMVDSDCRGCAKSPEFLSKVETLEHWIEQREEVTQVISIVDILKSVHRALNGGDQEYYKLAESKDEIAQELLFYSLGLPQGLSTKNRITVDDDAVRLTVMWTVGSSTAALVAIEEIETEAERLGLNATITGKYSLYQRQENYVVGSFLSSVGIALILISIVLCVCFRSIKLGMLALLPNLTPLLIGGVGLYLLRENLNVGTVLVVSITLGIAIDDTVHILTEYRRLRHAGMSVRQAFENVFSETALILLTTTSVLAVAFGMGVFASFAPYQTFGLLAAIVLIATLVIDMILLPALFLRKNSS